MCCAGPSTGPCLCWWEITVWQRRLQEFTTTTQTELDGVPCLPGKCSPSPHSDRRRQPVAPGISPALRFQTSNMGVHFRREGPGFRDVPGSGQALASTARGRNRKQLQTRDHCVLLSKKENHSAAWSLVKKLPRPAPARSAQRPQSQPGRDKVINSPAEPYSVVLILNCNQAGRRLREGWEGRSHPRTGAWAEAAGWSQEAG